MTFASRKQATYDDQEGQSSMDKVCDTCGNTYDKAFDIHMGGKVHTFDSFECAVQKLAPTCAHCECRILGHGVESSGRTFCCAHCAQETGAANLRDRAG